MEPANISLPESDPLVKFYRLYGAFTKWEEMGRVYSIVYYRENLLSAQIDDYKRSHKRLPSVAESTKIYESIVAKTFDGADLDRGSIQTYTMLPKHITDELISHAIITSLEDHQKLCSNHYLKN